VHTHKPKGGMIEANANKRFVRQNADLQYV